MSLSQLRCKVFVLMAILLCSSCGQKSYEELLEENRKLKQLISEREREIEDDYYERHRIIKQGLKDSIEMNLSFNFFDSILKLWEGHMPYCENKFASVNKVYSNENALYFIKQMNDVYEVVYTVPTKDLKRKYTDTIKSGDEKLNFLPDETGMYYWMAELKIHNKRTGRVSTYPQVDSIYIIE